MTTQEYIFKLINIGFFILLGLFLLFMGIFCLIGEIKKAREKKKIKEFFDKNRRHVPKI